MQAPLKEIDEVMENIEDIQNDIQTLKETTADLFAEQKTFDERMADGITRLLEKFKQREQELLEQVQSASANSPSAAAATQNEQLSAEIARLKQSLEFQIATKTILEGNVNAKETRIQELEAEVATLKLHNSEGTDEDDDEAFRSANTSESESDTGNEDTTSQVPLQDTDAQTQNSTTPVAGGGGMFSVASQAASAAASAAASVVSNFGGMVSKSSGAVTPRPQPPDTSIVPVPVNDQTQDTVPSSAVQVPQDQISASQVDESQVVAPEPVSNDASAAGAETQPVLSTLNSEEDVLDAILTYVRSVKGDDGSVKYTYFAGDHGEAKKITKIAVNPANREKIIKYFQTQNLSTRSNKTLSGTTLTDAMLQNFKNEYPST